MFMDLMGLYGSLFLLLGEKKCHPRVNKVNKKKAIFKNFSLSDFYEKFDLLI